MERKEERQPENLLSCVKTVAESLVTLGRSGFSLDLGFHFPAHRRKYNYVNLSSDKIACRNNICKAD